MLITTKHFNLNNLFYKNEIINFYKKYMNLDLDLDSPRRFTEKIQWLKLYDCINKKTECADKIKLREYCNNTIGKNICPAIIQQYNNINEFNYENIQLNNFFIKCNHGSGMNILYDANYNNEYNSITNIINHSTDIATVKSILSTWLKTDYSFNFGYELHYHNISPKIFLEEYIDIKTEVKFYCFNGIPKLCHVIFYDDLYKNGSIPKHESRHDIIVDKDYNFTYEFGVPPRPYDETEFLINNYIKHKPLQFNELLNYSIKLSNPFKFVRCDYYISFDDKAYLSELTFTPSSGIMKFKHDSTDYALGDMLNLK